MNNKLLCSLVTTFVICLIASTGCKKTNTAPSVPNAPSSSAPPSGADLSHAEGGTAPPTLAQVKYFKGSIGNSLDLQMKLIQSGDQLTGSYYYQKIGTKIELKGTLDKEGNVVLQEFDTNGKQTGLFRGIWTTAPDDGLVSIAGNWSKPTIDNKAEEKKTAFSIHDRVGSKKKPDRARRRIENRSFRVKRQYWNDYSKANEIDEDSGEDDDEWRTLHRNKGMVVS